jgi:hypothetical protein
MDDSEGCPPRSQCLTRAVLCAGPFAPVLSSRRTNLVVIQVREIRTSTKDRQCSRPIKSTVATPVQESFPPNGAHDCWSATVNLNGHRSICVNFGGGVVAERPDLAPDKGHDP